MGTTIPDYTKTSLPQPSLDGARISHLGQTSKSLFYFLLPSKIYFIHFRFKILEDHKNTQKPLPTFRRKCV